MNKEKNKKLIIISAPSGAGKTTLCDLVLKDFPTIALSISTTTRPMRPYEKEGVHYHFVDKAMFEKMRDNGEFAEWAVVHGQLYGTNKAQVEGKLSQGFHVLFDIDVQGAMALKSQYKDKVVLIFIHPPTIEALQDRLLHRKGDSKLSIEKRLQNAPNELQWSKKFQYQITNDNLNSAYKKLREIIVNECQ